MKTERNECAVNGFSANVYKVFIFYKKTLYFITKLHNLLSSVVCVYTVGGHKYSYTLLFIIYYTSNPPRSMKLWQNIDFNAYIMIIKENLI